MGLGAGLTKLIDKDKDKDRDRDEVPRARRNPEDSPHDIPSGWTSMIEDWLCNGSGTGTRINSPTVADVGSPKPLSPRLPAAKEPRKGPYTLLIKERMMGIYLAVYIHRDMVPLVRGTYSPRGVIVESLTPYFRDVKICCNSWFDRWASWEQGGCRNHYQLGRHNLPVPQFSSCRWVSISMDECYTQLFSSAHEGKIHHRLANLAKIKVCLHITSWRWIVQPVH
jgi:hypothetical protein